LAAYMSEGHFARHIRRLRQLYAERRQALSDLIDLHLSDWLTIEPSDQGLHLIAWLPKGVKDFEVAERCAAAGVAVRSLSPMYHAEQEQRRAGLMLGFSGFTVHQLEEGVRRLRDVLLKFA